MSIAKPNFFKRIMVMLYDALLLVAILIFSNALVITLFTLLAGDWAFVNAENFEQQTIVKFSPTGIMLGNVLFILTSLASSFVYYAWFWVRSGQTIGMKAWHFYLIQSDGKFISWKCAVIRYVAACFSWLCFGLGFAWALIDKNNKTWHDYLSKSSITIYKKSSASAK